jgi:V4R domain
VSVLAMSDSIRFIRDDEHRRCLCGGEPLVVHCHYYNLFLQRAIQDATYLDSESFLIAAASEVVYAQLKQVFAEHGLGTVDQRTEVSRALHQKQGFGVLDLSAVSPDGGSVTIANSHYAVGWKAQWDKAEQPVCLFARGWIAGALAAIFDQPNGTWSVTETLCSAMSGDHCQFEALPASEVTEVFESPQAGPLSNHELMVPSGPVDYEGIYQALSTSPLLEDNEGIITAFGVNLTWHYANYYNRISFEFLHRMLSLDEENSGELYSLTRDVLVEAGHVCAFYTLGGIMESTEWDALIRPKLSSREDWVHGIVAVINSLGWGRWQVIEVSEERAEFAIENDYESVGYLAAYGRSSRPVSFLAQGGVSGIMNLVYLGDISSRPELTDEFYTRLMKGPQGYVARPLRSRAMGDEVTSFEVSIGK